jgi:hypothetical protein
MFTTNFNLFGLAIIFFLWQSIAFCSTNFSENFTLLTTFKNEPNISRALEYLETLDNNIKNRLIKKIIIVYEGNEKDLFFKSIKNHSNNKVEIILSGYRPNLSFFFSLANKIGANEKIILSNADIEFDKSLKHASSKLLENSFLCLSRYELSKEKCELTKCGFIKNGLFYSASYDTWIFKTPIRYDSSVMMRFYLGKWGMEKFINYFLEQKYYIANPCCSIITKHRHESQIRYWRYHSDYDDLPHVYLPMSTLKKNYEPILSFEILVDN